LQRLIENKSIIPIFFGFSNKTFFQTGGQGKKLLARALSFNGFANAFHIAAINGGRHVAPLFAGSTVFAWSEVLDKSELPVRSDVGALRLRTIATKDRPCADFPRKTGDGDDPAVILDLDYWALIPR
jgi:2-methylfumaryl-CoA hydratase